MIKDNPRGEKGKGGTKGRKKESKEAGEGETESFYYRTSEKIRNYISGYKGIIR